jgi:hypothetical protein
MVHSKAASQRLQKRHGAAARRDATFRKFNDGLRFWQVCGKPVCRRRRRCSGDAHACCQRQWGAMPEEDKEYWRGALNAGRTTRSAEAMYRAGLAARAACLALQEKLALQQKLALQETPTAANGPGAAPPRDPPPDTRVRRL